MAGVVAEAWALREVAALRPGSSHSQLFVTTGKFLNLLCALVFLFMKWGSLHKVVMNRERCL